MRTSIVLSIVFIVFTALCVVVGIFVLPDTLVMQISISGEPSSLMSKAWGLTMMGSLGIIGAIFTFGNRNSDKQYRSYMILMILTIIDVLVFVFNL